MVEIADELLVSTFFAIAPRLRGGISMVESDGPRRSSGELIPNCDGESRMTG